MPENKFNSQQTWGDNQTNSGTIQFSWQVPEYDQFKRTTSWYIIWGVIALALIVYSIATANYLFALIVLMIIGIAVLQQQKKPRQLEFAITSLGIKLNKSFTPYKELKEFWIVYKPPMVKKIYFAPQSALRLTLSIHLQNQNPLKIREYLLNYLEENLEKEDETLTDTLNRLFKF